MKFLIGILIFLGHSSAWAQDTLIEQDTENYSHSLIVKGSTFESHYKHATGITYGRGRVSKKMFRWKLYYDSLQRFDDSYQIRQGTSDSIELIFRNWADSSELFIYKVFVDHNLPVPHKQGKFMVAKSELSADKMDVRTTLHSMKIEADIQQADQITIYFEDDFMSYIENGKIVLRKRKGGFIEVRKGSVYNHGKSWKVKRKIKYSRVERE